MPMKRLLFCCFVLLVAAIKRDGTFYIGSKNDKGTILIEELRPFRVFLLLTRNFFPDLFILFRFERYFRFSFAYAVLRANAFLFL